MSTKNKPNKNSYFKFTQISIFKRERKVLTHVQPYERTIKTEMYTEEDALIMFESFKLRKKSLRDKKMIRIVLFVNDEERGRIELADTQNDSLAE